MTAVAYNSSKMPRNCLQPKHVAPAMKYFIGSRAVVSYSFYCFWKIDVCLLNKANAKRYKQESYITSFIYPSNFWHFFHFVLYWDCPCFHSDRAAYCTNFLFQLYVKPAEALTALIGFIEFKIVWSTTICNLFDWQEILMHYGMLSRSRSWVFSLQGSVVRIQPHQ